MRHILRIILSLSLLLPLQAAFAQQTNESRKAQLEREIEILDRQIRDNANQSASALSRLSLVQTKISARQALIRESDAEISRIGNQIAGKQREINVLAARLDTMTLYYGRLVRGAYKNRDARVWYMYILSSENLSQGIRRFGYFRDLSREMNVQADKILAMKESLEGERANLLVLQKEAQRVRSERLAALQDLRKEESDAKTLSTRLQREKTKYQRELNAKKKEAEALEREIKKAITNSRKSAVAVDYTLTGKFADNKGKLPWPVNGSVTSRFGKQYHPVFKSLQLPPNNGITIAVAPEAEVAAVFDGVVSQVSILPGYHQCILVQHGGYFTLYSKIKTAFVKQGDKVTTGQKLGTVDTIGGETTFHFEIWNEKTTPQNPETWLRPR
ncbi:MAG: peptidoglycan DD-metalloendopeptidase family protein [Bacteroidales bacterium]|nr:peptidoglycan DD-metalloendopeptidase family protein [Bacteroidales bacterium]